VRRHAVPTSLVGMMVDRREFLKSAAAAAGATAVAASPLDAMVAARRAPALSRRSADVVVIGAGAFGGWTALYLQRQGARVTLVDQYGPGNSRASSGDETRGVRTGYGTNVQWSRWASESIRRWLRFDEECAQPFRLQLFFQTGDLTLRAQQDTFLEQTLATWAALGTRHEVLTGDEARYRYPQFDLADIGIAVYEPDAGVVRSRRACEAVAEVFRQEGGTIVMAHATTGPISAGRMSHIQLAPGGRLDADAFVFACGPWLWKVFPELLGNRMRTPLGHVYYFGTPPGDNRFTFPNMPSYNFPGVTGWPALGADPRGFRVRAGGGAHADPDTVERTIDPANHERPRSFLAQRFPLLAEAPIIETRACHYESSISRNFIIDRVPDSANAWIAGAGNAEAFKQGPVLGEYIAGRVLGAPSDPALDEQFRIPESTYDGE
jgi:sarcosine oxidase